MSCQQVTVCLFLVNNELCLLRVEHHLVADLKRFILSSGNEVTAVMFDTLCFIREHASLINIMC